METHDILIDRDEYRELIRTVERYNLERKKMHNTVESEVSEKYTAIIRNLKDQLAEKDIEISKIEAKSSRKCIISIIVNALLIAGALLLAFSV